MFQAGLPWLNALLTLDDKVARTHNTCAVMHAQHKMHTDIPQAPKDAKARAGQMHLNSADAIAPLKCQDVDAAPEASLVLKRSK